MIVLAVDPGTTTGLVLWEGEYTRHSGSAVKEGVVRAWEVGGVTGGAGSPARKRSLEAWRRFGWLEVVEGIALVVVQEEVDVLLLEDFVLTGGSHSSEREGLDPVRISCGLLGVLRVWGWDGELVMFSPDVSSVMTDMRMKRWGMWLQGRGDGGSYAGFGGHATSAARGLVWYLREKV